MELKPYPEYRNSDVKWIGSFPKHWDEKRAKYYFKEIDERSINGNEEMLSVSHITGVTPRSQKKVSMFQSETNINQKLCMPGDIVINTMWAWMSALGVSNFSGIVSPSYGVYRPINVGNFNTYYLDHLLRIAEYRSEYVSRSTGIHSSRLRLYPDKFLSMPIICPPMGEQEVISIFLQAKNNLVRKFIHNKRRLIDLLSERRGLLVMESLKLPKTKYLRLNAVSQEIQREIERKNDEFYTPVGLYNRGRGIFHKESTKGMELGDSTFYWVKEDDLIFSGQFAWEGAIALADKVDDGCVASHRYPIIRSREGVAESAYLLSFFRTQLGDMILNDHSRGAAGRNRPLNINTLMKEKVPIPPLNIQKEISTIVYAEKKLSTLIAKQLKALKEYQLQSINEVVLGKIDVRNIPLSMIVEEDFNEVDDMSEQIEDIETEENVDEAD